MLGLDAWTVVAAVGIVLLGGMVSGVTGFGFGLVIVPIMLTIFPPATVVAVNRALGLVTGAVILGADRRHVDRSAVVRLIPWAVAGLPVGILVLKRVDGSVIRLLAGGVVIAFAALAASGRRLPGMTSRCAAPVAGFSGGVLGTSIGMSGPPVVLLFSGRDMTPMAFRATITGYFVVLDFVAVPLLIASGAVGWHEVRIAGALLPVALIGRSLGRILGMRVERERFRRLTLGLLIVTGLSAVATALLALR